MKCGFALGIDINLKPYGGMSHMHLLNFVELHIVYEEMKHVKLKACDLQSRKVFIISPHQLF